MEGQKSTVSEMLEDLVQDESSHLSKVDKVWEQVVKHSITKALVIKEVVKPTIIIIIKQVVKPIIIKELLVIDI